MSGENSKERWKEILKENRDLSYGRQQRRVGTLPEFVKERIQTLSVTQLEALGEALLDFRVIEDLLNWLEAN